MSHGLSRTSVAILLTVAFGTTAVTFLVQPAKAPTTLRGAGEYDAVSGPEGACRDECKSRGQLCQQCPPMGTLIADSKPGTTWMDVEKDCPKTSQYGVCRLNGWGLLYCDMPEPSEIECLWVSYLQNTEQP